MSDHQPDDVPAEEGVDSGELELAAAPAAEPEPVRPPRRGRGGGLAGSALAGAMLGLRDAFLGKPQEDIVIQVDADGEPPDVDLRGLDDPLDDGARMTGPPLDDLKARAAAARRPRRR
jgi:hypothetical protein